MRELLFQFNPWWEGRYRTDTQPRPRLLARILQQAGTRDILFLVGLRRVGKTTLLHQAIERLLGEAKPETVLYASMDHPAFEGRTLRDLLKEFRTIHGLPRKQKVHLFLDEIHFLRDFERELKVLYDMENAKVVASGSSSLAVRHRGAFLTGRHRVLQVRAMDFPEFLAFKGHEVPPSEAYLLETRFEDYLRTGGMPEYVLRGEPEYLTSLVDSIIYKDIVGRYGVKHPELLRQLFLLLAERAGKTLSYNKLASVLGVSPDTAKQYVSWFEETYLVHVLHRHARSLNARLFSPKKVYLADLGIRNAYTGVRDLGALAENAVLLRLLEKGTVAYYKEGGKEVDFVQGDTAYEVKYRREVGPDDVKALREAPFRRRVLVGRGRARLEGIEAVAFTEFLG